MAITAKKVLENKLQTVREGKENALNELKGIESNNPIQFGFANEIYKKEMAEEYVEWANKSIANLEEAIVKLEEDVI